mmetsp:Transcript_621/g.1768  ORF Transcript_621/g.1768 Transcript_621/m.1768 type:complete len:203 (+) Transcript_621:1145-1753(+)
MLSRGDAGLNWSRTPKPSGEERSSCQDSARVKLPLARRLASTAERARCCARDAARAALCCISAAVLTRAGPKRCSAAAVAFEARSSAYADAIAALLRTSRPLPQGSAAPRGDTSDSCGAGNGADRARSKAECSRASLSISTNSRTKASRSCEERIARKKGCAYAGPPSKKPSSSNSGCKLSLRPLFAEPTGWLSGASRTNRR